MERLVIFDYNTSTIHIYDIEKEEPVTEEYISELGFNLDECYWMAGDIEFVKHKEILK